MFIRNRLKSNQGQVAIFVLMMFSLIFMFFGMAINVAMLVHHKINLQNAADMAAMAGAAEQARILNMIGWKNYELRKNYKDLVYRYWVQFNDHHPLFPDHRSGRRSENVNLPESTWTENEIDGVQAAPSYCAGDHKEVAKTGTRVCDITVGERIDTEIIGPPLAAVMSASIEPISAALLWQTYLAAQTQTTQASQAWIKYGRFSFEDAHADTIAYWRRAQAIYDTYLNPNNLHALTSIMNRQQRDFPTGVPQAWQNFSQQYINSPNPAVYTGAYTSELQEGPNDFHTLAEKTAYNNLNWNLRRDYENRPDDFFVTLTPADQRYLDVRPIELDFTLFFTTFPTNNRYIVPDRYNPITLEDFIVGIEKVGAPTFYAVMLRSQPRLPFLPGGLPWDLTAMAAAKPFGSRIGPRFQAEDYLLPMHGSMGAGHENEIRHPYLPYIKVAENQSINETQLLYDLKVALDPLPPGFDYENPPSGEEHQRLNPFLSPNRWESLRYIFPNTATTRQAIHPTDEKTTLDLGSYPSARVIDDKLISSWSPVAGKGRSGYSIQLIRLQDIAPYLDPQFQPLLETIEH